MTVKTIFTLVKVANPTNPMEKWELLLKYRTIYKNSRNETLISSKLIVQTQAPKTNMYISCLFAKVSLLVSVFGTGCENFKL